MLAERKLLLCHSCDMLLRGAGSARRSSFCDGCCLRGSICLGRVNALPYCKLRLGDRLRSAGWEFRG